MKGELCQCLGPTLSRPFLLPFLEKPVINTCALSASGFRLVGQGKPGLVYYIQASQDLVSWIGIGLSVADTNGNLSFTDPDAPSLASRAYRVTEQ